MNTIRLSDSELALTRHAMQAYLNSFGHDEADVVVAIKQVMAKLASAQPDSPDSTELIG